MELRREKFFLGKECGISPFLSEQLERISFRKQKPTTIHPQFTHKFCGLLTLIKELKR